MATEPSIGFSFGGGDLYPQLQAGAVQGLQHLLDDFGLFCEVLEGDILPDAMEEALEPTLSLARDVYCPIQTGELRSSGYVEARRGTKGRVEAEIGFGRGGLPVYAIAVHENPAAYHASPTQYKFLERAVYEDSQDVMERLYNSVKARARL